MGHCTVWAGPQHQGYQTLSVGGNTPYRSLSCKLETSGFSPAPSFTVHPTISKLFMPPENISVFTARICPPRRLENSLQNGLVLFFLYTVYDRGLGHIFIYISCFNTFKKKRGKYVDCEWKALLTLATWGESLHSAKTRHLCRNVLSLLKHLSKPAHLSPLALVSLYAVDFVNESADRWCHALISVCVWMCVCVIVDESDLYLYITTTTRHRQWKQTPPHVPKLFSSPAAYHIVHLSSFYLHA